MSIIESKISEWNPVSEAQRELVCETLSLLSVRGFIPPTLVVRTHHVRSLCDITRYWQYEEALPPYLALNYPSFLNHVHTSAFTRTDSLLDYYQSNPFEQMADTWGISKYEIENTRRSWYLFAVNYILRVALFPNYRVTFSNKPDRICQGCRGGVNGTGEHCKFISPTRFDEHSYDNKTATQLDTIRTIQPGLDIRRESHSLNDTVFSITYTTLFDPLFTNALVEQIEKPPPRVVYPEVIHY